MEYGGLFAAAFLAATLLPLPSEVPLGFLVRSEQRVLWPVLVATAGNYLGACTTYWVGRAAASAIDARRVVPSARRTRAAALVSRWGQPVLILSWVPIIGDALVAAAGVARMPLAPFSFWVILGKALRYVAVAWAV